MNYVKIKFVDFVPGGSCENGKPEFIYAFSHRINGRVYKRKTMECGAIYYRKKAKEWVFIPASNSCYSFEFMRIVASFLNCLNLKINTYDPEKREIKGETSRYE